MGLIVLLGIMACDTFQQEKDDTVLASAYGEELYLSDMSSLLQADMSPGDSMAVINSYTDAWIKDRILYQEAKKKGVKSNEISKLVDDYKKSLYINSLEESYLEKNLDTVVSQHEVDTFYNQHTPDFILKQDIVRIFIIRVPEEADNDTLKSLWKTEDLPAMKNYLLAHGGTGLLDADRWYRVSQLKSYLPESVFEEIFLQDPYEFTAAHDLYKYYVKVLEIMKTGEQGPVKFYYNTIRDRILHERARQVLAKMKKDLFNQKIKSKDIRIYSKAQ